MRRSTIGAAVAAAGLALAGCGGGTTGSATAEAGASGGGTFDPCSVLSAAEISEITTDAVTRTNHDDATCYYDSDPDDGVRLTVMKTGGRKQMEVVHRTAGVLSGMGNSVADKGGAGADAANLLQKDKTAAPQLGDEAAWGLNTVLSVRKGDMFVEVTPPMMHDPKTHPGYPLVKTDEKRAIAQKIAEKALAKLR
ncbi:hypothetical protein P6144_09345 [Sphingomonas sp. HITSZ_GF]|uniref:hypothetical protein n=1 Tax=Sphingomonas sp. HITSZ_GF TaxID=3037247 RepID=UPI00240DC35C|nr:hypothetical protein [Sphingomonas sp. HITSZ_GF]MDG2533848.1 hypothetical protein [Sphingomonas sp. HITSZ_GF]